MRRWSDEAMTICQRAQTRLCASFAPAFCPGGTSENSPAFQRWVWPQRGASPEGTAENQGPLRSPLRDLCLGASKPSVETPGLEFGHSCFKPSLSRARAESAPAYQPRVTPWETRPLARLRRPERAQAAEATPALAGRAVPLEAGFPGRCPGLMCPHAVGVQSVQSPGPVLKRWAISKCPFGTQARLQSAFRTWFAPPGNLKTACPCFQPPTP